MITSSALDKINQFNKLGLHYNLVADAVYKFRKTLPDPFVSEYMPYLIAALVSFDMVRMMGPDAKSRYDKKAGGFASLFETKLNANKPYVGYVANELVSLPGPKREISRRHTKFCPPPGKMALIKKVVNFT